MAMLAINAVLVFILNISAFPSHLRQVNFQSKLLDIQISSLFVQFSNSLFGVVMISRLCWSSHKHNLSREIIRILLFLTCCLILVMKIIVKAVIPPASRNLRANSDYSCLISNTICASDTRSTDCTAVIYSSSLTLGMIGSLRDFCYKK
jgi:hypothetical protein